MIETCVMKAALAMQEILAPLSPEQRELAVLYVYEPTNPVELELRQDAQDYVADVVELVRGVGGKAERKWLAERLGLSAQATNVHVRRAIALRKLEAEGRSVVRLRKGA